MPWWIWLIAVLAVLATVTMAVGMARARAAGDRYLPQHALPAPGELQDPQDRWLYGSMTLDEERAYREHLVPFDEWNPTTTEASGGWDQRYPLYNGHTWGCLNPEQDHPGACPEEGDWPDDNWPANLPDLPPAESALDDERARLVDSALALAADDPGDAGWTDQLLADLHDAPTVLDQPHRPEPSRLADTGEIELASLRADYAAELRAQDDDAAEFASRLATDAAAYRIHGLA